MQRVSAAAVASYGVSGETALPPRSPSTVNKRVVWSSDGAPFAHPASYLFLCYRLCVFSHFRQTKLKIRERYDTPLRLW